jgi:hypothetical protein
LAVLVVAGCGRTGLFAGGSPGSGDEAGEGGTAEIQDTATSTTADPTTSTSTGVWSCADEGLCPIDLRLRRAVDILFVVDNSGSMGGEQATLAESFGAFVNVLEAQQVGANYRIGVTTTAADGSLGYRTCLDRLDDFIFEWEHGAHDERERGCIQHCAYDDLVLDLPWVEKSEGVTNLPPGVDLAGALQCIGPPGINGPGWEQPLEAMLRVIEDNPSGFLRDDALLAVIFLTDEADCSAPAENHAALQSFQGATFWSDPNGATSGACWNAGVTCEGGPGTYDTCYAVDKGWDGAPTKTAGGSVLYPRSRYTDALVELSLARQAIGGNGQILLAAIEGVPLDYPQTGVPLFQDSAFADFNIEYGIGPPCNVGAESIDEPTALPDVRLKDVVESFASDEANVFSVCSTDYSVALQNFAGAIGEISERSCVGGCVADASPTAGLQPACRLVEEFPIELGEPNRVVEPCVVDGDTWDFPGPLVNTCYRVLDDRDLSTPTPVDDMAPHCITSGFNVELLVERRPEIPIPSGTSIAVACDLVAEAGVRCEDV